MQEYLLVAQDKLQVEFHQKQENGEWTKETFIKIEEMLELKSVDLSLSLEEIYRGVDF